jgi:hypothetical protein
MVILKEYRILLPFTLERYRIGSLYLTAKSSKGYSKDGEGIEVVSNEPFESKELGKGQYTKKIFHLSGLIPSWIKYLFNSLRGLSVVEEAWNCYPYCKTIFHCDYFGDKFLIEVFTMHKENDFGTIHNIHNLSVEDLAIRQVDYIDIVTDPVPPKKYKREEDPSVFISKLAKVGPLDKEWKAKTEPMSCAYKVVRVKFEKWLIGSRVEKAIHDYGFREIFLEVNRQCFCWADEWFGMSMDDVREFESNCAKDQNAAVEGFEERLKNDDKNDNKNSDDKNENKNQLNQLQSAAT